MSEHTSIYHSFAKLLLEQGQQVSPAELQGLMLGRCCAGADFDAQSCLKDVQILFDGEIPSSLHQAITGLQEMLKTELTTTDNFAVTLLLPHDESPLEERVSALAQWCMGFLSGFGNQIGATKLSIDVTEVLEDYVAISNIDQEPAADDDERSYMEIAEYLRVSPLLVYAEYGIKLAPAADDPDTTPVH